MKTPRMAYLFNASQRALRARAPTLWHLSTFPVMIAAFSGGVCATILAYSVSVNSTTIPVVETGFFTFIAVTLPFMAYWCRGLCLPPKPIYLFLFDHEPRMVAIPFYVLVMMLPALLYGAILTNRIKHEHPFAESYISSILLRSFAAAREQQAALALSGLHRKLLPSQIPLKIVDTWRGSLSIIDEDLLNKNYGTSGLYPYLRGTHLFYKVEGSPDVEYPADDVHDLYEHEEADLPEPSGPLYRNRNPNLRLLSTDYEQAGALAADRLSELSSAIESANWCLIGQTVLAPLADNLVRYKYTSKMPVAALISNLFESIGKRVDGILPSKELLSLLDQLVRSYVGGATIDMLISQGPPNIVAQNRREPEIKLTFAQPLPPVGQRAFDLRCKIHTVFGDFVLNNQFDKFHYFNNVFYDATCLIVRRHISGDTYKNLKCPLMDIRPTSGSDCVVTYDVVKRFATDRGAVEHVQQLLEKALFVYTGPEFRKIAFNESPQTPGSVGIQYMFFWFGGLYSVGAFLYCSVATSAIILIWRVSQVEDFVGAITIAIILVISVLAEMAYRAFSGYDPGLTDRLVLWEGAGISICSIAVPCVVWAFSRISRVKRIAFVSCGICGPVGVMILVGAGVSQCESHGEYSIYGDPLVARCDSLGLDWDPRLTIILVGAFIVVLAEELFLEMWRVVVVKPMTK